MRLKSATPNAISIEKEDASWRTKVLHTALVSASPTTTFNVLYCRWYGDWSKRPDWIGVDAKRERFRDGSPFRISWSIFLFLNSGALTRYTKPRQNGRHLGRSRWRWDGLWPLNETKSIERTEEATTKRWIAALHPLHLLRLIDGGSPMKRSATTINDVQHHE